MILDRYLGKTLIFSSLLSLFVLVAIFSFFTLVDQLDDTGIGSYGVMEAIQYVLLNIPRLCVELFPIATVIGSMATLGMLVNSSELAVIRTSGISRLQLSISLLKTGLIIVVFSLIIGEFIAPICAQSAQQLRSVARTQQILLKTRHGFWSRDGNSYININTILPDDKLEHINIFEFDTNKLLRSTIYARRAEYDKDKWILNDITQTDINKSQITKKNYETTEWQIRLNPEMIDLVTVRPQHLSLYGLMSYIDYLRANNQSTAVYAQAFWSKIINPFAILAMILLSICIVKCEGRPVGLGQRVFIGAISGISFHLMSQVSGYMGIVYSIPPFISVSLPTLLVFTYVYFAFKRHG